VNYIIVDLEATCWQERTEANQNEIIEIGALKVNNNLEVLDEFASFVRPIHKPILSDFCKKLTSITQGQVDKADDFKTVFARFMEWIGTEPFKLCSWGRYDFKQFEVDCKRHGVHFPFTTERHINLKRQFASLRRTAPCGMAQALHILGLPLVGTHHRGIDDTKNIFAIVQTVGPRILEA
jgi:inhibitor of KinA sporulation pathway (predicted exonuclease)